MSGVKITTNAAPPFERDGRKFRVERWKRTGEPPQYVVVYLKGLYYMAVAEEDTPDDAVHQAHNNLSDSKWQQQLADFDAKHSSIAPPSVGRKGDDP